MHLENLVVDAVEPQHLGAFWEAVLDTERLTDEPDILETRHAVAGGPELDLCFQRVAGSGTGTGAPEVEPRLLVEVAGGSADRLLGLGAAEEADGLLLDPEGNPFRVLAEPPMDDGTGSLVAVSLVAVSLASADPERDARFWAWLTGWTAVGGTSLRHPSGRGPVIALRPEREPKAAKNRMHLDVRLERGDDADEVAAGIVARGGRELHPNWGTLPWRLFEDPSGNDLCVLPSRV